MSDDQSKVVSSSINVASNRNKRGEDPLVCDPFLQWLVDFANQGGELSIILNVGGAVVSGDLVGIEGYFEALVTAIEGEPESAEAESDASRAQVLQHFRTRFVPPEEIGTTKPRLIHLKNATIYTANRAFQTAWWRGRLEAVDGFALAQLPQEG